MAETAKIDWLITKEEAAELWLTLRNALASTEKSLRHIIETRAWEPMGYASFAEAWAAEQRGSWIATELRTTVVLTMLAEGRTPAEVREAAGSGSGITIPAIESAQIQRDAGVPDAEVEVKPIKVRNFTRDEAPAYVSLSVGFPPEILREYHRLADESGELLTNITRDLLAAWAVKERVHS